MMLSKIFSWIGTLWGKVTALAIGGGAILVLVDYFIKWRMYAYVIAFVTLYAWPFFLMKIMVPMYFLLFLVIALSLFFLLLSRNGTKKEAYYIPVKRNFSNGSEPNDYDRKTKWNFKGNTSYYFVPLLSHSYNHVSFVDFCGPYCARCNHLLHTNKGDDMGNAFFCVNCVKVYKIPKELLSNYWSKLFAYFQEEYRQRRLKGFQEDHT